MIKTGKTVQELFISLSDRENLNRFPSDIPEDDLIAFFTLSTIDKDLLVNKRGDPALRYSFARYAI
jgi:hypothetical protein